MVSLQCGINAHNEWELDLGLVFLVIEELREVPDDVQTCLVKILGRYVNSEQALLGVDFPVEFKHFFQVLGINDELLVTVTLLGHGHGEAATDVILSPVNGSEEHPHDDLVVFRLSEEVFEDVGGNVGVDQTLYLLEVETEVQIWEILGQLGLGLATRSGLLLLVGLTHY